MSKIKTNSWELNKEGEIRDKTIELKLETPLKIERKKKIITNPDYREIILNGIRRLKLITHFYGENNSEYIDLSEIVDVPMEEKRDFEPITLNYYSFRQRKRVKMMGISGKMVVKKKVTPLEKSLLKGFEIIGLGKATSFGFGKVSIDFK